MKFNLKNIAVLALLAAACMSVSCKKEKTATSLLSLNGTLWFDAPIYALPGDVLTLTPRGASHPKDGDYGYYWQVIPRTKLFLEANDTTKYLKDDPKTHDGHIVLTIPDTLCTFTVKCSMFADGYYNAQVSVDICVVKDESIGNIPHPEGEKSFTDERDGNTYTYLTADGLDWMSTNLRYAEYGKPYEDCPPITRLFGNLYTYDEAEQSCPEGWRIPTLEEWQGLCGGSLKGAAGKLMVDAYFNQKKMWEYWPDVKITNETGMNVMPVGFAITSGESWRYSGSFKYAVLWTSTDFEDSQKCSIGLYMDQPDITVSTSYRDNFAASVRCVRSAAK